MFEFPRLAVFPSIEQVRFLSVLHLEDSLVESHLSSSRTLIDVLRRETSADLREGFSV